MEIQNVPQVPLSNQIDPVRLQKMQETAKAFEAVFLSEMLKHAGLGESREVYGGGEGEEAFASMLADEQASIMAEAGGIGLAEHILQSLIAREAPK